MRVGDDLILVSVATERYLVSYFFGYRTFYRPYKIKEFGTEKKDDCRISSIIIIITIDKLLEQVYLRL